VEYATLDDFVDELHQSIAVGATESFKERYGRVDILLLDDVQFLTGRRETQTELLKLFNALQGGGRQIVMTSDRPPLRDRRRRRAAGVAPLRRLIVDIGSPDYETRVAILRNTSDARALTFAPGVLEELARLDMANVRELQGALNRLAAFQGIGDAPLRPSGVRAALGDLGEGSAPTAARPTARRPPTTWSTSSPASSRTSRRSSSSRWKGWRVRLGEEAARWGAEGFVPAVLERAMRLPREPDVDGLLATFAAAVDRLRVLEQQAAAVDSVAARQPDVPRPRARGRRDRARRARPLAAAPAPAPDPRYRRSALTVGTGNAMAVRAADTRRPRPACTTTRSSCTVRRRGQTHLLHARGNELRARGIAVACVNAQAFSDELIAALQDGRWSGGARSYRAAGALVGRRRASRRRHGAHAGRAVPPVQRAARRRASRSCSAASARRASCAT
jgi:chromosomal replication initiation ATPase DnaA